MTSIPPATPVTPAATSTAAPAAPAAGSTAVLTQLPEAVRTATPGTVIAGTVVGRDNQGQTLLQTDSGLIALRTAAQLAVGSQITLQLTAAGSQLQAVLLSALAPKPGGAAAPAAPRPGSAQAASTPATTLTVSPGPVLTATVLSPTPGGPLPQLSAAPPAGAPSAAATQPGTTPAGANAPGAAQPGPSAAQSPAPAPAGQPIASTPSVAGPALPSAPLVAQAAQTAAPPISSAAAATYAAASGTSTSASPQPGASSNAPPASAPLGASAAGAPQSAAPAAPSPGGANVQTAGTASAAGSPQTAAPASVAVAQMQPTASGTPVQLRLVGSAPGAAPQANQITGTVLGYVPGGQAVVDTALGRLALTLPPGAPHPSAGTSLLFEILGFGGRSGGTAASASLPVLGREWPALKSAMTAVAEVDVALARQILEVNVARLGSPRFLGQVLHFLASPSGADTRTLLGDTALALLERAGRGDVLARLDAELREMHRLNASSSDWRVFYVPALDVHELRQLRIFTRRRKAGQGKEREGGRFVVECEFEEIGPLQIDGLVQKPRIDVILRSHVELAPGMQAGIAEAFGRTCDASGLVGKIFFQATAAFPVSPLDEIAKGGPGLSV